MFPFFPEHYQMWDCLQILKISTRLLCFWRSIRLAQLNIICHGLEISNIKRGHYIKTLPKAQRTRGLSSYQKFKHKSWSNFIFRISTKHQLQNSTKHQPLHKTKASKSWSNLASESRPRFNFIYEVHLWGYNLYKTSAEKTWPKSSCKSWLNLVLKVWTKV